MENWMYFEKLGPSLNKKNLLKNTPASNANPGVKRAQSFKASCAGEKKRLSSSTFPGVQKNPRLTPHRKKNVKHMVYVNLLYGYIYDPEIANLLLVDSIRF